MKRSEIIEFLESSIYVADALSNLENDIGRYFRGYKNGITTVFHSLGIPEPRLKKPPKINVLDDVLFTGLISYFCSEKKEKRAEPQWAWNKKPEQIVEMLASAEKEAERIMKSREEKS